MLLINVLAAVQCTIIAFRRSGFGEQVKFVWWFDIKISVFSQGQPPHYGLTCNAIKMSKCFKNWGIVLKSQEWLRGGWNYYNFFCGAKDNFFPNIISCDYLLTAPPTGLLGSHQSEHNSDSILGFDVLLRNLYFHR